MPATIPMMYPDDTKTVFAVPETQYNFHQPSHIFSGQNTNFMAPDVDQGVCFIVAKFNYAGELENGTIKVVGGIPSKNIPLNSVLLQGSIVNVDTFSVEDGRFQAYFFFRTHQDHALLDYDSHFGVWSAFWDNPGWPSHFHRYLFRRSWGPKSAPLNLYIGQVKNIV